MRDTLPPAQSLSPPLGDAVGPPFATVTAWLFINAECSTVFLRSSTASGQVTCHPPTQRDKLPLSLVARRTEHKFLSGCS